MPRTIDLNADIGEYTGTSGEASDNALLDVITSANIACGVHAGDRDVMRRTVNAAAERGVAIGAHPSFDDREGFGRREMNVAREILVPLLVSQITALAECCEQAGARLRYVKPHGALYNMAAQDIELANVIAEAVRTADASLVLLGMANSPMLVAASKAGLRAASEAFADRAYLPSGKLAPRDREWAVLHNAQEVAARSVMIASEGCVYALDGSRLRVDAQSLCVHGDNPNAIELVKEIREALGEAGIGLAPFAA